MERIESSLSWIAFGLLATVILLAPWCFGTWEAWWFWPFMVLLSVAAACFGLQLLLEVVDGYDLVVVHGATGPRRRGRRRFNPDPRWRSTAIVTYLLFVVYAGWRVISAPVFVDAQRSLLLFTTAFLVAFQVAYGFRSHQRRIFFRLILVNLFLLGLYGIINHAVCGSRLVLWRPGFPQYIRAVRATGSYFCPDHYAGIMEIALCLARVS